MELNIIRQEFASLKATQAAQHQQNRTDIHRLSNGQESILLTLREGLDKIAEKVSSRCEGIEEDVTEIKLQIARALGWVAGAGALAAVAFELVKLGIEHIK